MKTPARSKDHTLFLEHYLNLVKQKKIKSDPEQFKIAKSLESFIKTYQQTYSFSNLISFFSFKKKKPGHFQGVYLWGSVGRGKSMLSSLAFETINEKLKAAYHFHDFMEKIHKQIAYWRHLPKKERLKQPEYRKKFKDDPIPPIAKYIARNHQLIYLDEFEVIDITDAMILSRLFTYLIKEGVSFIITSNTVPENLYKNGLNRSLFLPFISFLRNKLHVLHMKGCNDFRERFSDINTVYFSPLNSENRKKFETLWKTLTRYFKPRSKTLNVFGRSWKLESVKGNCVRLTFDQLFREYRSSADYHALSESFDTIFLENLPVLNPEERDTLRRFTLFIDILYDRKKKIIIFAEIPLSLLFPKKTNTKPFERTISRLKEMQSEAYYKNE